jgi:hypothetical protein
MNELMKLSRDSQIILGATVLYVILSFLDWQQFCATGGGIEICGGGINEWHGIGFLAALIAVVLLAWEIVKLLGVKIELGAVSPALISVALAIALLVFTVLTFLSHNEFRNWPQWVALIVSIVIAVVAVQRGRVEGVEIPKMASALGSGGGSGGSTTAAPPSTPTGDSGPTVADGDEGGESPQAT